MSDKAMEGQISASESADTPNPQFSQGESATPSPGDSDAQLDVLLEKLTPKLEETFERLAQSSKDKGIASAKKDASEAKEEVKSLRATVDRFDDYMKRYGDKDTALAEMERDEKIERILSGQPAQADRPSGGTDDRPWGVRQKEILDSVGVDLADPRVVELAKRKTWDNPDEYLTVLSKESFGWVQSDLSKPQPDISTVANPSRSVGTRSSGSIEELGNRLVELQRDWTKNADEIASVTKQIEQLEKEG